MKLNSMALINPGSRLTQMIKAKAAMIISAKIPAPLTNILARLSENAVASDAST